MTEPPTPPSNHMAEATREAVRLTRERLAGVDLAHAAMLGGLALDAAGRVVVDYFGRRLHVAPGSLALGADDGAPLSASDEGLVLRYLEAGREVRPLGESITFRHLPGGNFYFGPVQNRTSKLILKVFGNDLPRLRAALGRYPHTPFESGDFAARVHAIGRLDICLIYRLGDDEFPPTLDILYDKIIAAVYRTDEVAALATRLCVGLIRP